MILKEIKKGQFGTGLLIENDGFISIDDPNNKTLKEELDKGTSKGNWEIPYPFVVHALYQRANKENANGRIYPRDILERQIELYQQRIQERRAYSENNHPSDIVLDINNLSTNIIELHWEGDNVVGQMEILISYCYIKYGIVSTRGDLLANLLYFNRVKLGVSSRGVGSVEQKYGKTLVQNDFELICFDNVTDPSTHNAWIDLNPEGLKPYMESNQTTQTTKNKTYIIEKLDKIINNKLFI